MGIKLSDAPTPVAAKMAQHFSKEMSEGDPDFTMSILAMGLSLLYQGLGSDDMKFAETISWMAKKVIEKGDL